MVKFNLQKVENLQSDCSVLFITKYYTWFIKLYDIEPNTLIYVSNEFKVTYRTIILIIDTIFYN